MEFYSQLRRRMGVAIVGPPRTGKTSIRNIVFNVSNLLLNFQKCFKCKITKYHNFSGDKENESPNKNSPI